MAAEALQRRRRRGLQQEEGVAGVMTATTIVGHHSLSFPLFRWPCFPTAPTPLTRKTLSPGAAVADSRATRRVVTVERGMRRLAWWELLGATAAAAGGVRAGQEGGCTMNRLGLALSE